ncbi:hypothetical protein [Enterococcus casseliflavus]|nr:hypothetical protein [Enterococcus casseliflavus]
MYFTMIEDNVPLTPIMVEICELSIYYFLISLQILLISVTLLAVLQPEVP